MSLSTHVEPSGPSPRSWALSLRAQLILGFILIDIFAAVVCAAVIVVKARRAAVVEMNGSVQLAEILVAETIRLNEPHTPPDRLLETLAQQLSFARHVRIAVFDTDGKEVVVHHASTAQLFDRKPAPAWFTALIAPPPERHPMPVIAHHRKIGTVYIIEAPQDEGAEVWEDATALATIALVANLAIIGAMLLIFDRILEPLTRLSHGFLDLEQQNFATRVAEPPVRELAEIVRRFNHLAAALGDTHNENRRLNQRLINLQDEERRRIALDLHDEFGPCLFGLSASLRTLQSVDALYRTNDPEAGLIFAGQTKAIGEIVARMQAANRSILRGLRPMALGHVPLRQVLDLLIGDFSRFHPDISIALNVKNVKDRYGEAIDLTVYRCVQESLTNAIRHSTASEININIEEIAQPAPNPSSAAMLQLTVEDTGEGLMQDVRAGFGLAGMKERIDALGGLWSIANREGRGARVSVALPI